MYTIHYIYTYTYNRYIYLYIYIIFLCKDCQKLEERLWNFHPQKYSNLSGHSHEKPVIANPLCRELDQISRHAIQLYPFFDSLNCLQSGIIMFLILPSAILLMQPWKQSPFLTTILHCGFILRSFYTRAPRIGMSSLW